MIPVRKHSPSVRQEAPLNKCHTTAGTSRKILQFPEKDAIAAKERAVFAAWANDVELHEIVRDYGVGFKFINRVVKERVRVIPGRAA